MVENNLTRSNAIRVDQNNDTMQNILPQSKFNKEKLARWTPDILKQSDISSQSDNILVRSLVEVNN